MSKTIGQVEAELTTAIVRFEKEYLGRGPKDARTYIIEDMILIRLKGILTPAEQKLAENKESRSLVKETRRQLFESSRPLLAEMVRQVTGAELVSLHTDMSSMTGERIVVLTTDANLQKVFNSSG
ncbi:MAG: DUF2294 domain-containing protein [Candidatus Promineifilaceae bacterium]|nr:DUF2294 domain-containing protein [Candidatus Promineifilaceae bacterium]